MSLFCGSGGRRKSVIHLFSRDLAQGKVPAGHGLDRLSRTACDRSTLLRATSMQVHRHRSFPTAMVAPSEIDREDIIWRLICPRLRKC